MQAVFLSVFIPKGNNVYPWFSHVFKTKYDACGIINF